MTEHSFGNQVRYGAILADPPWKFETYSEGTSRMGEKHYSTSRTPELAALDVASMAAENCALFLWTVDSHLDQALSLIRGWGFTYKTVAFVWVKQAANGTIPLGLGHWTRKQAEVCLLATRGRPKRLSGGVRQVILAPRREHSRKPDEQYARIEALVGGPYLELFARQAWPNWDQWGNEVGKFAVEQMLELSA